MKTPLLATLTISLGMAATVSLAQSELNQAHTNTVEAAPTYDPIAAPPPAVRLPAMPNPLPLDGSLGAESDLSSNGAPTLVGELGWDVNRTALREPTVSATRTNRPFRPRGVLPKITRPERRGLGGFLSGFANLFNPFAPVEERADVTEVEWVDPRYGSRPAPRGFRDAMTQEPQWNVLSVGLERTPVPVSPAETSRP